MEKITLCGDNCLECPRYLADTDEKRKRAAELSAQSRMERTCCFKSRDFLFRLFFPQTVYLPAGGMYERTWGEKCNQCRQFPCAKITDMLKRSKQYEETCRNVCTPDEYRMLRAAFFDKEKNLLK